MSRRANCYDNAAMESFFSTLKTELTDRFPTREAAEPALFEFIEVFYNQQRLRLNSHYGNERKISARIEDMVAAGHLDRLAASKAHYWRIVRNVHAHAGGRLDQRTIDEINKLTIEGKVLFDRFRFRGPLMDARKGGAVPVPLVEESVAEPHMPDDRGQDVLLVTGRSLPVGLSDLLASADVWADVIDAAA